MNILVVFMRYNSTKVAQTIIMMILFIFGFIRQVGTIGGTYFAVLFIHYFKSWHPVFYIFGMLTIVWCILFVSFSFIINMFFPPRRAQICCCYEVCGPRWNGRFNTNDYWKMELFPLYWSLNDDNATKQQQQQHNITKDANQIGGLVHSFDRQWFTMNRP